jgi:hypothetical protein
MHWGLVILKLVGSPFLPLVSFAKRQQAYSLWNVMRVLNPVGQGNAKISRIAHTGAPLDEIHDCM